MSTWKITLIATVIGTVVGLTAWLLNITRLMWPAHPQFAGVLLTIATGIIVQIVWSAPRAAAPPRP